MSNIRGLSDYKVNSQKKDTDEEFAVSASTAVWRPTTGPGRDPAPSSSSSSNPSQGPISDILAAARSQQQQSSSSSSASSSSPSDIGVITLYSNGFILGSGEFRDAKDANNASFLADLKKGEVPAELEAICRKEWGSKVDSVRVSLVDKSSEAYTPPKPSFSFASSKGQSLSSSSSSSSDSGSKAAVLASFSSASPSRFVLNSSLPTTTLQLVLSDRKKLKETFNQDTTVMDVYQHVMSVSGLAGFELVSGFPPKVLTEPNKTLKEAGLLGAQVQQRGGS